MSRRGIDTTAPRPTEATSPPGSAAYARAWGNCSAASEHDPRPRDTGAQGRRSRHPNAPQPSLGQLSVHTPIPRPGAEPPPPPRRGGLASPGRLTRSRGRGDPDPRPRGGRPARSRSPGRSDSYEMRHAESASRTAATDEGGKSRRTRRSTRGGTTNRSVAPAVATRDEQQPRAAPSRDATAPVALACSGRPRDRIY
jgi:hypothetical protein